MVPCLGYGCIHTLILGPLIRQNYLRLRVQSKFVLLVLNSSIQVVKSFMRSTLYNSNTFIRYKLSHINVFWYVY